MPTIEANDPLIIPNKAESSNNFALEIQKIDSPDKMKGLVYEGPGKIEWKEILKPCIKKSTDALIKILKTTICGTDLGILHGKIPSVKAGTVLGHEGVGVIEEVGIAVRNF